MKILGVNAYHPDSSAAILVDGKIVFAIEEERLTRVKHWSGFPRQSIEACLNFAQISIEEVDFIAINSNPNADLKQRLKFLIRRPSTLLNAVKRVISGQRGTKIRDALSAEFRFDDTEKILDLDHHVCHLSSAYHASPFGEAAILSIDGFGDFASTAWGLGMDEEVTLSGKIYFPHSLGIFYQAMTQWLGFHNYGDEYKVMGLAPYGEARFVDKLDKVIKPKGEYLFELNLEFFRHHNEKIDFNFADGIPEFPNLYTSKLTEFLGPARRKDAPLTQEHKDFARSVQVTYEKYFLRLVKMCSVLYGTRNIALAGGCANNSVANGKIVGTGLFDNVYVQSAAGDAGGAVGAAYTGYVLKNQSRVKPKPMSSAYYGPEFSSTDIDTIISVYKAEFQTQDISITKLKPDEKYSVVAKAISNGKVIGWFQGRMEWGPRALGARSILGDPRRADMKDILNLKIKRRESFRPFAPSVLEEKVSEWFEDDDPVPFMMQVYKFRKGKGELVPAVCHVDYTGRLQTVNESNNPQYYKLIRTFEEISGVPMLLNTSFNENEPVVCNVSEAINCFLRTNMDLLAIEDYVISREES